MRIRKVKVVVMITKEEVIDAIRSGKVYPDYFRPPTEHVVFMCDDEYGYGKSVYVIRDDGATDFGCMVVQWDELPCAPIRFDWYSGKWLSDDEEMTALLMNESVLSELNAQFSVQLAGLSPDGGFGCVDSVEGWRKIISLCLNENESQIQVNRETDCYVEDGGCNYSPADAAWNNLRCYQRGA